MQTARYAQGFSVCSIAAQPSEVTPIHGDNADQGAGLHLLKRLGEAKDIAQMVYTVAKSNFINGAIINVDGGLGAGHNLN